jgi:hypothetical protein
MTEDASRHPTDLLAEFAAGVLAGPGAVASVEAHLPGCPSCRQALEDWRLVAAPLVGSPELPPSGARMVRAVLTRSALAPMVTPVHRRGISFAGQLLGVELRLVRPSVWLASLLVMACAVAMAVTSGHGMGATVLSLVAPLIAAGGVGAVAGPRRDPALEALSVTVTSPRLILLARVTLVFAYDFALAVLASAVVWVAAPQVTLGGLVTGWLGPMTLLSALCLLLAMWTGPNLAMGVAGALWALRVLTIGLPDLGEGRLAAAMRVVWATNPGSTATTLVLLALALLATRHRFGPRAGWSRSAAW